MTSWLYFNTSATTKDHETRKCDEKINSKKDKDKNENKTKNSILVKNLTSGLYLNACAFRACVCLLAIFSLVDPGSHTEACEEVMLHKWRSVFMFVAVCRYFLWRWEVFGDGMNLLILTRYNIIDLLLEHIFEKCTKTPSLNSYYKILHDSGYTILNMLRVLCFSSTNWRHARCNVNWQHFSTWTTTISTSSFTTLDFLPSSHSTAPFFSAPFSTSLLCSLPLFHLPGSSIFNMVCLIYPLSLFYTCANHFNLVSLTFSTWAVPLTKIIQYILPKINTCLPSHTYESS